MGVLLDFCLPRTLVTTIPTFGGTKDKYQHLFCERFDIEKMEMCNESIEARQGRELFVSFKKEEIIT